MNQYEKEFIIELVSNGGFQQTEALDEQLALHPDCLSNPLVDDTELYAIHFAAMNGNLTGVKYILSKDPDCLEVTDSENGTPLFWAVRKGRTRVVQYLLEMGASCYNISRSASAITALQIANYEHHDDCVELIENHLLKARQKDMNDGADLLSSMSDFIRQGNNTAVRYLLEQPEGLGKIRLEDRLDYLKLADEHLETETLLLFFNPRHRFDECRSRRGHTLVEWLVSNGLIQSLRLFVTVNADESSMINSPSGALNLLRLAKRHEQAVMLNHLIYCSFLSVYGKRSSSPAASSSQDCPSWPLARYLPYYLMTLEQWLDLAAMDSRLIPWLFNNSEVIQNIEKIHPNLTTQYFYLSRNKNRRHSFFGEFTPDLSSINIFKPESDLGEGFYGLVRRFMDESGREKAVKTYYDEYGEATSRREQEFMQLAYPDEKIQLFSTKSEHNQYRLVMPLFSGNLYSTAMETVTCVHAFANIVWKTAIAIKDIHQKGMIHGDLKNNNIIVSQNDDDYQVFLIDFGHSGTTDKPEGSNFPLDAPRMYPPELLGNKHPAIATPAIDVYMFGHMVELCNINPDIQESLPAIYPSITTFIQTSKAIEPGLRPSIASFCEALELEIQNAKTAPEPASSSLTH